MFGKMEILKSLIEDPNVRPWAKEWAKKELRRLEEYNKRMLKRLSQPLPEFKLTKEKELCKTNPCLLRDLVKEKEKIGRTKKTNNPIL